MLQDRKTLRLQGYPAPTKSSEEKGAASQQFVRPQFKAEHVYSDNSKEIKKACDELGYLHDTCTPHRPATNGVAERAVRRVKEGTSCALDQSGFFGVWWKQALICYRFLRNIGDVIPMDSPRGKSVSMQNAKAPSSRTVLKSNTILTLRKTKKEFTSLVTRCFHAFFKAIRSKRRVDGPVTCLSLTLRKFPQRKPLLTSMSRDSRQPKCLWAWKGSVQNTTKYTTNFFFPVADGSLSQPEIGARRLTGRRRTAAPRDAEKEDAAAEELVATPHEDDSRTIRGGTLTRTHCQPQTNLFQPDDVECLTPIKYLDIHRKAEHDNDANVQRASAGRTSRSRKDALIICSSSSRSSTPSSASNSSNCEGEVNTKQLCESAFHRCDRGSTVRFRRRMAFHPMGWTLRCTWPG